MAHDDDSYHNDLAIRRHEASVLDKEALDLTKITNHEQDKKENIALATMSYKKIRIIAICAFLTASAISFASLLAVIL